MTQALEIDLGGLSQRSWDDGGVYGADPFTGATDSETCDGEEDKEPSLASLTLEPSLASLTLQDLVDSHGPDRNSLAAFRQLKSDDIDMFIANMAVPPPPSRLRQQVKATKHSPVVALTSDDLSAFIIPPPPATVAGSPRGGDREVLHLSPTEQQKMAPVSSTPNNICLKERLAQLRFG